MAMRQVALAGLRERFPSATPQELRRRLATILLGPQLATKVYGPEPDPPTVAKDVVSILMAKKASWDLASLDTWPRELHPKDLVEKGLNDLCR